MAKKLGKKARKFAKKNLQSVMKRKRKLNAKFNKKSRVSTRRGDVKVVPEVLKMDRKSRGTQEGANEAVSENDFDSLFIEENDDFDEDGSDSDGYLSEDPECPYISESESNSDQEGKNDSNTLLSENMEIRENIANQKSKLDRLLEKDPKFSEFLESRKSDLDNSRHDEIYSDEEGDAGYMDEAVEGDQAAHDEKVLTSSTIDVWCWLVMENSNGSAFHNLLNSFRSACHFGVDSNEISSRRIPKREVFSKILTFVLSEAEGIFCRLLGVKGSMGKDNILRLTNKLEWITVRPLVKSYLRSSLYLLNQESEHQILIFVLSRLRASISYFAAFPSLTRRLIKISVHLWATGDESLSLSSYLMIRDIALQLSSDYLDTCLTKTYQAFIANCKFVESASLKHIEFLLNSVVDLYSLDIQKSYQKVFSSMQQVASILRQAIKTKKKEELKKLCSWQYINCIRVSVKFVSCNFREYDLQALLFLVIQVIRGIAHLFPGTRHKPLRIKCVKMLNQLSLSSGAFIPIASLVFDSIEYRGNSKVDKHIDISALLKVPKQFLKSRAFEEECVLSATELLSEHFSQWSHHISFPELATIPLILLKRCHEKTTLEGLRRNLKRLIDQVQENSNFIQRKRDEVSFSPNDQLSVDSFLQLEKKGGNAPFTRYYTSILQNSLSRNMVS